jgi:hypothetical protein
MSDLEGAKLKVERANGQIKEIFGLVEAYSRSRPYEAFVNDDAARGLKVYKIRRAKKPPEMISVVVGECLYSLRSALDQICYAVCTRSGFEVAKSGFVIERTEKEFEAEIQRRNIEVRTPEFARTLRELRPYEGGNDCLWQLHWLNARDTHRTLLTLATANQPKKYELRFEGKAGQEFGVLLRPMSLDEQGCVLLEHPLDMKIDGQIAISIDIGLSDIESPKCEPVIPTLRQFSGATASVISIFEERFFKTGSA